MKKINSFWLYIWFVVFFLLIIVSIFFRGFLLSSLPSSLNRDEAALAYNALTLKTLGVDEWGRKWPLALESFGDYKLIGYPAVLAVFFEIFKIHDWTVRAPSMLAGIGIIALSFMIGRKIFPAKLAWLFTTLVAITPVFLFYSRSAWEANLGFAYILWAYYLLFFHLHPMISFKRTLIALALTLMAVLTYNTPLILMPLIIGMMPFFTEKQFVKRSLFLVLGVVSICLVTYLQLKPLFAQKTNITIFSDPTIRAQWIEYRQDLPQSLSFVFGNQYFYWFKLMTQNFLASFSPKFLVSTGGAHPWHSLPEWGHIYMAVYFLALLELGALVFSFSKDIFKFATRQVVWKELKKKFQEHYVWLYFLIVSLLPAIVTVDAPHATRSLLYFWLLVLLATKGVWRVCLLIERASQKPNLSNWWLLAVVFWVSLDFSRYFYDYFKKYPSYADTTFQTGFSQVVEWIESTQKEKQVAVVDPTGFQYILLAWYLKLDPSYYLDNTVRQQADNIGFKYGERVGRYHFVVSEKDVSPEEKIVVIWDLNKKNWLVKNY